MIKLKLFKLREMLTNALRELVNELFLEIFFYGKEIITVNPPEVWPDYTLPTRGLKLITLPTCTSIRYPPRYPPHPQTIEKHPFMPN